MSKLEAFRFYTLAVFRGAETLALSLLWIMLSSKRDAPSKFIFYLPSADGENMEVGTDSPVVIVGANGSGKTRLGEWIEFRSNNKYEEVHRISAQKSLSMPNSCSTSSMEDAELSLYYGFHPNRARVFNNRQNWLHLKRTIRWNNNPSNFLLNDFKQLMVYLFTDQSQKNMEYCQISNQSTERIDVPITKLDKLKRIWERILPERELFIELGKVSPCIRGDKISKYNPSEMSDGERVIFYLIGQSLAAPENGIIIIDEPEIHIHKSIQYKLWSAIEAEREDCLFIYFTHDLDFAASRQGAKKIWLESYDGKNWKWSELESIPGFREEVLMTILGSRQPTIFVEGDTNSIDTELYRICYPDHLIIPSGGCEKVIESVKALKNYHVLHNFHLDIQGIIDRDRRTEKEIEALSKHGIHVLKVAEVENLFLLPEVIKIVCQHLKLPDEETLININKL